MYVINKWKGALFRLYVWGGYMVTHTFNPSSMPHASATNKDAAAIPYVSKVQATLHIE